MATLTIPNVPDSVMRGLEALAREHGCTVEVEAWMCLQKGLSGTSAKVALTTEEEKVILERVRLRRESLSVPPPTEEFLRKAKNWGRP